VGPQKIKDCGTLRGGGDFWGKYDQERGDIGVTRRGEGKKEKSDQGSREQGEEQGRTRRGMNDNGVKGGQMGLRKGKKTQRKKGGVSGSRREHGARRGRLTRKSMAGGRRRKRGVNGSGQGWGGNGETRVDGRLDSGWGGCTAGTKKQTPKEKREAADE